MISGLPTLIEPSPLMSLTPSSSTKVRLFLKKDLSVRYLIPDPVVEVCYHRFNLLAFAYTW
jgi:hypothetical protein